MNAPARQQLITALEFPENVQRLPYVPQTADAFGIDNVKWKVLTDSIFPHVKSVDSILMALTYCRARNLDIMKRPVHIVPIYSSAKKAMIDTIWPSIAELRTTAARTGEYAGKDETAFGPDRKEKLGAVEVEFPEWAQTTVYRVIKGVRCAFVGPRCYWKEYYATAERTSKAPNDRWTRAPHGQIEKCAEAGALRMAFPEELGNDYAAEEMEGQIIIDGAATTAPAKRVAPPATPIAAIESAADAPKSVAAPEAPAEVIPPTMAGAEGQQQKRRPPSPTQAAPAAQEKPKAATYADDAPAFFKRFAARCGEAKDYDALQDVWLTMIDPITDHMDSVDFEEAQGIMRDNERRLEP